MRNPSQPTQQNKVEELWQANKSPLVSIYWLSICYTLPYLPYLLAFNTCSLYLGLPLKGELIRYVLFGTYWNLFTYSSRGGTYFSFFSSRGLTRPSILPGQLFTNDQIDRRSGNDSCLRWMGHVTEHAQWPFDSNTNLRFSC